MSERFAKKWESKREDEPFANRIKDAVKPPGPLKPRLDFAVRRIELQVQKLDQATDRFGQRDKAIFARIVDAYTVIWENIRCSILFHLLVPGGKWQTDTAIPV